MSLLSNKPRNRKRHSRKSTKVSQRKAWIHKENADKKKLRSVKEDHFKLNAQIGAIETFLAGRAMQVERRMSMHRNNILPPPETSSRAAARQKMSRAERRRYLEERERGGMRFFFLFILVCAVAWWLLTKA